LADETYPYRLPEPILETMTAETGVEVRDIRLEPARMNFSSGFGLLPFHQLLIQDPLMSAETTYRIANYLSKYPVNFYGFIANGSILIDRRVGNVNTPIWGTQQPTLDDFLQILHELDTLQDRTESSCRPSVESFYESIPPPLRSFIYQFLQQASQSLPRMEIGRETLKATDSFSRIIETFNNDNSNSVSFHHLLDDLYDKTDLVSIFHASAEMCYWLNESLEHLTTIGFPLQEAAVLQTSLGCIVVAGSSDDTHHYETPPFLLLDCGGNDTYQGTYSRTDENHPFSITIDLGGKDKYSSTAEPMGAVSSFFGCAALLDHGPESDRYTGTHRNFGYAFGGVCLLYDEAGDTIYEIESLGLGASEMGIAISIDGGGDDTYFAFKESQGFGSLGGFGILYDVKGNDRYITPATPVVTASAQLSDCNHSGSQGFGQGWFGPIDRGLSFWGGVGMLIDGQGDDTYEASVFAQGSGYGYGLGFLADLGGKDTYRAEWYAMGAGAHQGGGFFFDQEGDDLYEASHYMIGGSATDLSLGVFWDDAGDDRYTALNASFGYGLTNSCALFTDASGNDRYFVSDNHGMGHALNQRDDTLRGLWPTFGLFFDLGGHDEYPMSISSDGKRWQHVSRDEKPYLIMLGMDAGEQ